MKLFLTFLLLFFIAYYFLKALIRLINVFLSNGNQGSNNKWPHNKKGNITIENPEKLKKRFDRNNGEYIDYEEIK